ncbi:hypothetical protein [Kordiimonas gwangyangensis]|uniref:hypothetical protein n=1 Tax=Kordiimonas gwangyangensis TaxID=288022 RepID=UPI00037AFD49|nr:hypothetical protein [Kordiimonas gwangyangensis]
MKKKIFVAALLASLSHTVAAEGPSLQETRDYIFGRCNDIYDNQGPNGYGTRYYVGQQGAPNLFTFTVQTKRDSKAGWVDAQEVFTVDLRETDILQATEEIVFSCAGRCIRSTTQHVGANGILSKYGLEPKHGARDRAALKCREATKTLNAFKHLQDLAGGRKKDPFAG